MKVGGYRFVSFAFMFLFYLVFVPKRKRESKANDEPDSKRGKIVSVGGPAAIFKAQPLTIEELKKNASALNAQQDQGGKPVFMTAAARKKLAEERERVVEEEEQQKEKEIKESRETFFKQGEFLILIVRKD